MPMLMSARHGLEWNDGLVVVSFVVETVLPSSSILEVLSKHT